jgi:hypothetical protein
VPPPAPVAVQRGTDGIVAEDVLQRQGLRHRDHVVEVQRVDVPEVVEHGRQLLGVAGQLLVGQLQASQAGDVGHLGRREAIGHV